ncbi:MAG: lytic transglycosylase domain-containing protein [Sulfuricella denitrificans]|nr:lytic transglycosylase domain-containing protein [Sulfuricella denitrificans]
MDTGVKLAILGGAIGAILWKTTQPSQPDEYGFILDETWTTAENAIYETTGVSMGGGTFQAALAGRGAPYAEALAAAESVNSIPANMLARLAYQESHFRQDIISGQKISSAGAVGIMQIVPRWHPDVDPLDPFASIAYAGRYLASLYRQFGRWDLALQAYNWGPGNMAAYLAGRIQNMPIETANYSRQILADIGSIYA